MYNGVQPSDISHALETLRNGALLAYPTDTIWGIGCDATDPMAVGNVYQLKGRDQGTPLIVLLDHESRLSSYVNEVPEIAYQLIEYTERPLTIVYPGAKNLAHNLVAADGSIGIRIVKHPFCEQLLRRFRKPIVSTSANASGQPAPRNFSEIDPAICEGVDYIAEYGREDAEAREASIIMRLEPGGKFSFIRK